MLHTASPYEAPDFSSSPPPNAKGACDRRASATPKAGSHTVARGPHFFWREATQKEGEGGSVSGRRGWRPGSSKARARPASRRSVLLGLPKRVAREAGAATKAQGAATRPQGGSPGVQPGRALARPHDPRQRRSAGLTRAKASKPRPAGLPGKTHTGISQSDAPTSGALRRPTMLSRQRASLRASATDFLCTPVHKKTGRRGQRLPLFARQRVPRF